MTARATGQGGGRKTKGRAAPRGQAKRRCLVIVLAAGEGKRMRSKAPKVLACVAGLPMIGYAVKAAQDVGADRIAVVIGPGHQEVAEAARSVSPQVLIFEQAERRGTAHAVLAARAALAEATDDVLVLFGDTPLVEAATLSRMRAEIARGAPCVALGFEARDPTGYGRFLVHDGELTVIREHKDASAEERKVTLCNAGLIGLAGGTALEILDRISDANAQREFYLTDAVEVARGMGLAPVAITASETEVMGVNDRLQLAVAEAAMQRRLRETAMLEGATLVAPETVFLSHDTRLGRDVLVEPHVVFGPGVVVDEGVRIRAFSHLEGAHIRSAARVGPFARLRPGADIGEEAHIGNFVEVKKTRIGRGAKANHLAYLGDASVGAGANIGAGAITCNYDGFDKHETRIGAGAFIGTNSALVAPLRIGEGAYIATGSVITEDVPKDALALGRARQVVKPGWAKNRRARAGGEPRR
ncbi:bifunctional UDP-N-acetylglucosamine pyrophosphorylase / Glucosamine-1-phosphate N-acetyltransferase [Rhizobiales bacterium GAS191]|nr:bifunctional UDP-N-acetylglucosamine pyrophosphorylase / Glucosamine-1-phosphate N-acetyltransferase [Rhizobiales bacterium GAS191]